MLVVRRFVLVICCWQRLARVPLRRRCKHDDAKSRCLIVTLARVETLCFAAAPAPQFVALVFVVRHAYHPSPLFTLSTDRSGLTPSIRRQHDTLISSLAPLASPALGWPLALRTDQGLLCLQNTATFWRLDQIKLPLSRFPETQKSDGGRDRSASGTSFHQKESWRSRSQFLGPNFPLSPGVNRRRLPSSLRRKEGKEKRGN